MIPKIFYYCRFGGYPHEEADLEFFNTWNTIRQTLKRKPFQSPAYFKNLLYHYYRQLMVKNNQQA